MTSSCPVSSCNIEPVQTSDGVEWRLKPTVADGEVEKRREMPSDLPEGLFRDQDGCAHVLPFSGGFCARDYRTDIYRYTFDQPQPTPGVVPGINTASATITNDSPYRQCVIVIRQIGCVEVDARPGSRTRVGLGEESGTLQPRNCLATVPQNIINWPNAGVVASADPNTRVMFAYLGILGAYPEADAMTFWAGEVANGTYPDDLSLWTAISDLADQNGDPRIGLDATIPPQQWTTLTVLAPGDTATWTATPWAQVEAFGGNFSPPSIAIDTWGVSVWSFPQNEFSWS